MEYSFNRGRFNVHYLTAPYELLVLAFGDDGTTSPRDEDKVTAQWDGGDWEVYDYRTGGPRESVTEWHVQGTDEGIGNLLATLEAAVMSA